MGELGLGKVREGKGRRNKLRLKKLVKVRLGNLWWGQGMMQLSLQASVGNVNTQMHML